MPNYGEGFFKLIEEYASADIEFANLKTPTVAMWILESARGHSRLAREHGNFAGMKYRSEISDYASRVLYEAHDGAGYYCAFDSLDNFITGFWKFLDRSPYEGWRNHAYDGPAFIEFIGGIWAEDPAYVTKVQSLFQEAEELLSEADGVASEVGGYGQPTAVAGRASVRLSEDGHRLEPIFGLQIEYRGDPAAPYGRTATRNKRDFAAIILHHNKSSLSLDWLVQYQIDGDPGRGGHFGYHFYIDVDGSIVQGAPMSKRTNHINSRRSVRREVGSFARNQNAIGISHVGAGAATGSAPTRAQEEATEALCFALCDLYDIPYLNVFGHGEIQTNRHRTEGRDIARTIRGWAHLDIDDPVRRA